MKNISIMMIGGGIQEIPAVKIAKSLGVKVIVADRNPNAPCFKYADYKCIADGRDIESLIAYGLLNKDKLNIKYIFTLTELVTSVSAISKALNLPGTSLESVVKCQNKELCKTIWLKNKVSTPNGGVVTNYESAKDLFLKLNKSVFIKKIIGFGGVGARKIIGQSEFDSFFNQLNQTDFPLIMEEFINGDMFDVNGFIDMNGNFHKLGIVDRFFLNDFPVEKEIRSPSRLSKQKQEELYNLFFESVIALGIEWGPVKGDIVLDGDSFKILEVAPRLHGPKNSVFLLPSTGMNILEYLLKEVLNDFFSNKVLFQNKKAIFTSFLPSFGKIVEISGTEKIYKETGIEKLLVFAKIGDTINKYEDSTHVPAYVLVSGKSWTECESNLNKARKIVKIKTV